MERSDPQAGPCPAEGPGRSRRERRERPVRSVRSVRVLGTAAGALAVLLASAALLTRVLAWRAEEAYPPLGDYVTVDGLRQHVLVRGEGPPAALAKKPKAKQAFATLTKGKQREFAEYIAMAKQDKTKTSRLAKILPLIAAGAGLNDKYRNC